MQKTVFVVDDDDLVRETMIGWLETYFGNSISITGAQNGKQAINLMEGNFLPDLIITDFDMPEKDGLKLLEWLSKSSKFSGTPAIMVTGDCRAWVEKKTKELRYDFFLKTCNLENLRRSISEKLGI